jgi:SH3-like domain-containing protein
MSRQSLTFFLLIVSFGILFAGCGSPAEQQFDEFTFTDSDLQTVHEIADGSSSSASGSAIVESTLGGEDVTGTAMISVVDTGSTVSPVVSALTSSVAPVVDTEKQRLYDNIRTAVFDQGGGNIYRVNNPFLNVRASMDVSATQVARLNQGDVMTVLDIPNAGWAKVRLQDGKEGYVSFRYIAKLTTDQKLPEEKKQFEGKYFVDYAFLNMRKDPSTQSEKLVEIPGQAIIKPLSMNGEWARVSYSGKEGYVSAQYLKPFLPVFLVRQDEYTLPILQYHAEDAASIAALPKHVAALKTAGKKIVTLRALYDTVMAQESRDSRIAPGSVAITVLGVNAKNVKAVGDALQAAGVGGTLFIQTKDVGVSGITEKTILNLLANGNDLQSGGHTGDDLRAMTDSQVSLELGQSKKLIEDITHREVYAVGYPKGGVNDRIMEKAADLAYLFGEAQSPDTVFTRSAFLRLPSLIVGSGMSPEDVVKLAK